MSVPTVRLTGPADLLAVLPHMLGYQPEHSLLCVAVHTTPTGARVGMVARLDMPEEGEALLAAETLTGPMLRESPTAVVIIGYEKITGEAIVPLDILSGVFTASGLSVMDRVAVSGDRWRSLHCENPDCCPPEGSPMPGADAAPALHFVAAGSAPLASREAVVARVAAGPRAEAVGHECERQSKTEGVVTLARGVASWARILDPADAATVTDLSDETLALSVLSLHVGESPALRDALLAWITPGSLPLEVVEGQALTLIREQIAVSWQDGTGGKVLGEEAAQSQRSVLDRLCHLCAALPDSHAAPARTVLANLAWWVGDGALASIALDRALSADPDYRLAVLLDRMVSLCVRP